MSGKGDSSPMLVHGSNLAEFLHDSAAVTPMLVEVGPSLVDSGANSMQFKPVPGPLESTPIQHWPSSGKLGRFRATLGRSGPTSGQVWTTPGQIWPSPGQSSSIPRQLGPIPGNCWSSLVEIGPNSVGQLHSMRPTSEGPPARGARRLVWTRPRRARVVAGRAFT